ncbi:hypothetical protein C8F01DRAFT_1233859 [Mycena amicta]|nr:hypothetical protein C8F01DRAFT_1233859 [Mycena amicta]
MPRAQNKSKPTARRTPQAVGKVPPDPPLYAKCPDCPWSFPRIADLERHAIQHLTPQERESMMLDCPYPDCQHRTLQQSNLRTHIRVKHSRERPYACSKCSYTTADPSCLRRHEQSSRSHHGHDTGTEDDDSEPGDLETVVHSQSTPETSQPLAIQLPKLCQWSQALPTVDTSPASDSSGSTASASESNLNPTWTHAYPRIEAAAVFPSDSGSAPPSFPSDSTLSSSYPAPSPTHDQWAAFNQYQDPGLFKFSQSQSQPIFDSGSAVTPGPPSQLPLDFTQAPTPAPNPALQYHPSPGIEGHLGHDEVQHDPPYHHLGVSMGYSQSPVHMYTDYEYDARSGTVSSTSTVAAMGATAQPLSGFQVANVDVGYSCPPSRLDHPAHHEFELPLALPPEAVQPSFDKYDWEPSFIFTRTTASMYGPTPVRAEWGPMFSRGLRL